MLFQDSFGSSNSKIVLSKLVTKKRKDSLCKFYYVFFLIADSPFDPMMDRCLTKKERKLLIVIHKFPSNNKRKKPEILGRLMLLLL